MNHTTPIVDLRSVSKTYDSSAGVEPTPVLKDISLAIQPGESVAITGASGSGKSTLLNIIGTLDQPSGGEVYLEGEALSGKSEKQLAVIRSRRIGFVFQAHHLLPQCTALENVLLPTLAHSDYALRREAPDRARQLLQRVGLAERMNYRPGLLSGGERQRVAIVRAMINRPALLLADEPTGALDQTSADSLADLLCELNHEQGLTLIVVTHNPLLASRMEKQYHLSAGKLVRHTN